MAIPAALPDSSRTELTELYRIFRRDGDPAALDAALYAFNKEGWAFRQLGDALGLSHESVRSRAKRAEGAGATATKLQVPPRPQALDIIPTQELDPGIVAELRDLRSAASEASEERTGAGLENAVADFFHALHAAREAGWDEYAIAAGIGSHPKAIFKFIGQHSRQEEGATGPSYPTAPVQDLSIAFRSRRPEVLPVEVPEDDAAALQLLEEAASADRNGMAAAVHNEILGGWYLQGVNRAGLEKATGLAWETVRKRLASGGYMMNRPR